MYLVFRPLLQTAKLQDVSFSIVFQLKYSITISYNTPCKIQITLIFGNKTHLNRNQIFSKYRAESQDKVCPAVRTMAYYKIP